VITSSPNEYTVRIVTGQNEQADTPVPADGRVSFDVPVSSRYCTPYVFGVIKVGWPRPVEDRRVIRVMRGEKVIRKLSASDIARLATDAEGYGIAGRDYHQPAGMVAPALTLKRFVLEIGAR